jgi:hypothetical protein
VSRRVGRGRRRPRVRRADRRAQGSPAPLAHWPLAADAGDAGTGTWDWDRSIAGDCGPTHVFRYETDGSWTRIRRLVGNDAMDPGDIRSWNRVPCMAVFQGRLFAGTSTCHGIAAAHPHPDVGRVFSAEAGRNVSFDGDLGPEWRHVAIVRDVVDLQSLSQPGRAAD